MDPWIARSFRIGRVVVSSGREGEGRDGGDVTWDDVDAWERGHETTCGLETKGWIWIWMDVVEEAFVEPWMERGMFVEVVSIAKTDGRRLCDSGRWTLSLIHI